MRAAAALGLVVSLVAGCGATVDPSDANNGNGPATGGTSGVGGGGGSVNALCTEVTPGPAPVRRLTRFEYNNTVRDLLGDVSRPGDRLPPELKGNGFSNDAAALTTTRVLVDSYRALAIELGAKATLTPAAISALSPCDVAAQGEDVCAKSFIADFGGRAFRRPLNDAENAAFFVVYTVGKESATHADGLKAMIEMALQSPQFLYRLEFGTPVPGKTVTRPTSSEMATRLSYMLWGSTPDARLLDVAKAGQLETAEQVSAQAQMMLGDPRARDVVRFFTNTLYGIGGLDGLERNAEAFPTFTPNLGPLFRQETERFIENVVWDGAGDFATLFNAPYTFVNGPLAAFYGIPGVPPGDAFQRVELDPSRRLGLLTQASILAATTPGSRNNPVVRGKFIYEELFCGHIPSPPVTLNVTEPPADPTLTTRERFSVHRENDACRGCHTRLDPIGFGLENFDGVGLWRDTENGKPIDASGELPDGDAAGAFLGPAELAKKVAGSADARSCFAGKWLDFAYGRVAGDDDVCTEAQLQKAFADSRGNVKALLLALTQTDAFLYLPADR